MKTRGGFVSNSSSSSFIVAVKKPKHLFNRCECCGITPIPFLDVLEEGYGHQDSDGSEMVTTNREKIITEWVSYETSCVMTDDERNDHGYQRSKAKITKKLAAYDEKEWDVAWIQIGYHDRFVNLLWEDLKKNKTIEIIEDMT